MEQPGIEYVTYVAAPPEKVWVGLVSPALTQQYWGEKVESDWNDGSRVVGIGPDGTIHWRGEVLEYESPHLLSYTLALPEGEPWETRVRFDIEQMAALADGAPVTRLTMTQDRFHGEDSFYSACREAWPKVLSSMKSMLESGRTLGLNEGLGRAA
jgi:uncharacterized protein YndB with AHSA1/START domain